MITQEQLKELMHYNPETGIFTRVKNHSNRKAEEVIGIPKEKGYLYTHIYKKKFLLHRLAFLYMNGQLPPDEIEVDHRNRINNDNRWSNLRLATNSQNNVNKQATATSGFKGVDFRQINAKWRASITVEGKHIHLGYFQTAEEAARKRDEASVEHFGEFAVLNF